MESSLNILHQPNLSWSEKIAYLAWKTLQNGGPKPEDFPIEHIFQPGRYIREMRLSAGQLFIGRIHLRGHIVLLCEGSATLITPRGSVVYTGPDAIITPANFQTVGYMLTDVRVRSIHPNPEEERDVKVLEERFFGPVESVLALGQEVQSRIMQSLEHS